MTLYYISLIALVLSLCIFGFWFYKWARQELQIRYYKRLIRESEATIKKYEQEAK